MQDSVPIPVPLDARFQPPRCPERTSPAPAPAQTRAQALSSFGEIYQTHYRFIAGAIFRRTGDADLTEDLTSDVFLAAYRSMRAGRYRATEVPLQFWLLRIATNRVNRWTRRSRGWRAIVDRLKHAPASSTEPSPPGITPAVAALRALPTQYQAVLSLHHVEGLTIDETARVLACSASTVNSRLTRARAALRRQLMNGQLMNSHPAHGATPCPPP
jgi:DNA-directed RNA polymerase specialized sigma24 family protein